MLDPIHVDSNLIRAPILCEPVTRAFPASRSSIEYMRLARFFTLADDERDRWMRLSLSQRRAVLDRPDGDEAQSDRQAAS